MSEKDPIKKTKEDYTEIIKKIAANTSVGIDPQLTHSIIIDYLQQLTEKVENIERKIFQK